MRRARAVEVKNANSPAMIAILALGAVVLVSLFLVLSSGRTKTDDEYASEIAESFMKLYPGPESGRAAAYAREKARALETLRIARETQAKIDGR